MVPRRCLHAPRVEHRTGTIGVGATAVRGCPGSRVCRNRCIRASGSSVTVVADGGVLVAVPAGLGCSWRWRRALTGEALATWGQAPQARDGTAMERPTLPHLRLTTPALCATRVVQGDIRRAPGQPHQLWSTNALVMGPSGLARRSCAQRLRRSTRAPASRHAARSVDTAAPGLTRSLHAAPPCLLWQWARAGALPERATMGGITGRRRAPACHGVCREPRSMVPCLPLACLDAPAVARSTLPPDGHGRVNRRMKFRASGRSSQPCWR